MTDTPKFIHIPTSFEWDPAVIEKHRAFGESHGSFIDGAIATMREREEKAALDGMTFAPELGCLAPKIEPADTVDAVADAMAMIEATAGGVPIGDGQRVIKMPGDGEPAYMMFKEPDPIGLSMSMKWDIPKSDPLDFIIGQRCGGFDVRPPMRIVTVIDMPMPRALGVDAMLADGWVWTGWRFARDQEPRPEPGPPIHVQVEFWIRGTPVFVRFGPEGDDRIGYFCSSDLNGNAVEVRHLEWVVTGATVRVRELNGGTGRARSPGRCAGYINDRPVLAGRYAGRLPTNRKRKRERCKARRRAR